MVLMNVNDKKQSLLLVVTLSMSCQIV